MPEMDVNVLVKHSFRFANEIIDRRDQWASETNLNGIYVPKRNVHSVPEPAVAALRGGKGMVKPPEAPRDLWRLWCRLRQLAKTPG